MSAINPSSQGMPGEFYTVAQRLESAGGQFRMAWFLGAFGRFFAVAIPAVVAILFTAGIFDLPHVLRWVLLLLIPAVMALAYWCYLHKVLWQRPDYAQIARWVELHAAELNMPLENRLINAVLLAAELQRLGSQTELEALADPRADWIPAVLREIDAGLAAHNLGAVVPWKRQTRPWLVAGVIGIIAVVLAALFPNQISHGFAVLTSPGAFVPRRGIAEILSVTPGDETVLAGEPVEFTVHISTPTHEIVRSTISFKFKSGKKETAQMALFGENNTSYRYLLPSAAEDVTYMVDAGGTQSRQYAIHVLPKITMASYDVAVAPPAYTLATQKPQNIALTGDNLTAEAGSFAAPLGSHVVISAKLSHALLGASALIEFADGKLLPVKTTDGQHFTADFTLAATQKFDLLINDAGGRALQRFPQNPVAGALAGDNQFTATAIPDAPPAVHVFVPHSDVSASPGGGVALAASASDDYGLTDLQLQVAARQAAGFTTVRNWQIQNAANGKPATNATIRYMLQLPASQYKIGDVVRYRFTATDNRNIQVDSLDLGPQTTTGHVYKITLAAAVAAAPKNLSRWEALERDLELMLQQQRTLRDQADAFLLQKLALSADHTLAGSVQAGQRRLRSTMTDMVAHFNFPQSMATVRQALDVLSHGDATGAVARAGDLAAVSQTGGVALIANKLRSHQVNIINVLKALLAIASNHITPLDSVTSHQGGRFPNEEKAAWKQLLLKLKKFEKQQRDVLNATAALARKPVNQYDANDKHELAKVKAAEDKWSKFLNQALTNMSNITEQDQAAASLVDDLAQMKVDLAMTKNALKLGAIKIATPLEANGLEDAKKETSHIERWLMQQPDTMKWSMEEPVAQNDVPAPPLPDKLTDMMGKLLQNEEDMTNQMEDTGSKWNDSMNKGLGWAAMDGPISDMSAQGVTGNNMPHNDEIQGRSGEGREGRASGEMVGQTAVGKGGRRTPTRLTNDPFSTGVVKDTSKQPPGGATGGGKKAGWGGEGLEGPAPLSEQKDIKRMAGQQAQVLNKTERLMLQMRAAGFNNFKLIESAVLMQDAQKELKKFHYHTAMLYQKMANESMSAAKVLTDAQAQVALERTAGGITKKRHKLSDSMIGTLPKGYADPVKAYFEKLSNGQ